MIAISVCISSGMLMSYLLTLSAMLDKRARLLSSGVDVASAEPPSAPTAEVPPVSPLPPAAEPPAASPGAAALLLSAAACSAVAGGGVCGSPAAGVDGSDRMGISGSGTMTEASTRRIVDTPVTGLTEARRFDTFDASPPAGAALTDLFISATDTRRCLGSSNTAVGGTGAEECLGRATLVSGAASVGAEALATALVLAAAAAVAVAAALAGGFWRVAGGGRDGGGLLAVVVTAAAAAASTSHKVLCPKERDSRRPNQVEPGRTRPSFCCCFAWTHAFGP